MQNKTKMPAPFDLLTPALHAWVRAQLFALADTDGKGAIGRDEFRRVHEVMRMKARSEASQLEEATSRNLATPWLMVVQVVVVEQVSTY